MLRLVFVVALLATLLGFSYAVPSAPEPADSGLQKRRALDVCAYLNTRDPQLGQLRSVFCISGVKSYINFQYAALPARQRRLLNSRLQQLIYTNGQICTYPQFSTAFPSQGAVCLFVCARGFTANQNARTCDCTGANKIECNNRCVTGTTCASRVVTRQEKREISACPTGQTQCGVRSSRSGPSLKWECLHTQSDLESCGGCVYPFSNNMATGRDCSAIKGVSSVSCNQGVCAVQSCRMGYQVSANGTSCALINGFRVPNSDF